MENLVDFQRIGPLNEECMAGRVLKRIARENVNVSLTLPASLPFDREFAPWSASQSVEKSDSVTPRHHL